MEIGEASEHRTDPKSKKYLRYLQLNVGQCFSEN